MGIVTFLVTSTAFAHHGSFGFNSFIDVPVQGLGLSTMVTLENGMILNIGDVIESGSVFEPSITGDAFTLFNADGSFHSIIPSPVYTLGGELAFGARLDNDMIIIAGSFFDDEGNLLGSLALLNANGSFHGFIDSPIYEITGSNVHKLANGMILVGGTMEDNQGAIVGSLALLNTDGTFHSFINSPIFRVDAVSFITLDNGDVIMAGRILDEFSQDADEAIVRLNADGSFNSFVAGPLARIGEGVPPVFYRLPIGDILIAGILGDDQENMYSLALLNSDGTFKEIIETPDIAALLLPSLIALDNNSVFMAGYMMIHNETIESFAFLNADGTFHSFLETPIVGFIGNLAERAPGEILAIGSIADEEGETFGQAVALFAYPAPTPQPPRRSGGSGSRLTPAQLTAMGVTITTTSTTPTTASRNEQILNLLTTLERDAQGKITQAGFVQFIMMLIEIIR
ncbi:MAG: hypothetical protein LRY41_02960 [Candidatus Pacebacteria bacterium]|nr:hypothetical protein [Candidatus Paceibacterota bacterium]